MNLLLMVILLALLVVVTALIISAELALLRVNKSPFIPTPTKAFRKVLKYIEIENDSVVYELGCGDARVLLELYKTNPNARYVGVEKLLGPYLLAKINVWWVTKVKSRHGNLGNSGTLEDALPSYKVAAPSVKILKKDIFATDVSDATHVFMFLSADFMEDLYPKFREMLQPGTKVISHMFEFRQMKPVHKVQNRNRKFFGRNFYIYEF